MDVYTYPRSDNNTEIWSEIDSLASTIWSLLAEKSRGIVSAENELVLSQQNLEDVIRQARKLQAQQLATSGVYREAYSISFKDGRGTLEVDSRGECATLPVDSETTVPVSGVSIVWEASSTYGIPGSYTEVIGWKQGDSSTPLLASGNATLSSLIDNQSSTHFEWERSILDNPQYIQGNDGQMDSSSGTDPFVLIAPDTWSAQVPERSSASIRLCDDAKAPVFVGPLRLVVELDANDEIVNYLQVSPYYPLDGAAPPFVLEKIENVGNSAALLSERDYNCSLPISVQIGKTAIDRLRLTFRQDSSYRTTFGHKYYAKKLDNSNEIVRVLGSEGIYTIAISSSSISADKVVCSQYETTASSSLASAGVISASSNSGITGWDIFTGSRWCIGLRELTLQRKEFASKASAEYGPLKLSTQSSYVNAVASYSLPDSYTNDDWVVIEGSNNAKDWVRIDSGATELVASDLYVRITLTRPSGDKLSSPVLEEVKVYIS